VDGLVLRCIAQSLSCPSSSGSDARTARVSPSLGEGLLDALRDDPLSQPTRAQHRNVLVVGSVAILVASLDLVPREISAIGVRLAPSDRRAVLIALLVALAYFAAAFLIYGAGDFVSWLQTQVRGRQLASGTAADRRRYRAEYEELLRQFKGGNEEQQKQSVSNLEERLTQLNEAAFRHRLVTVLLPIAAVRAVIDFAVPITVAGVAAAMLWGEL
jgi:hypothetical protein